MDSTRSSTVRRAARRPTSPLWWVALAVAAVIGLIVVNAAAAPDPHVAHGLLPRTASGAPAVVRARAAAPTTTTTTAPAPVPPPAVAPQSVEDTTLHTPEDVPDPSVRRPIQIIGRIQIPKIGLDTELRDQITQESIDLGPSHWPGTAAPGGFGNAVVAGHRNSYSAPFHDFAALRTGDAVVLVDASGRAFTYRITEMFVVNPDAIWITEQTAGHNLTLFTCHPIGSAAQRLVVRATLV
jgi:sortase A